jgi:hypothetical protein
MWRLFLLQNLLKKRQLACIISLLAWQHDDNKNLDSPYFADNLNTPDNVCKNTHTKLFKLQFSGASGNNNEWLLSSLASFDSKLLFKFLDKIVLYDDGAWLKIP